MQKLVLLRMFISAALFVTGCGQTTLQPDIGSTIPVTIISPSSTVNGSYIPVVIVAGEDSGIPTSYDSCPVTLSVDNGTYSPKTITLKRGIGSGLITVSSDTDIIISAGTNRVPCKVLQHTDPVHYSGHITSGEVYWDASHDYIVDDELTIDKEASLIISEGTRIAVSAEKDIIVYGTLRVAGTRSNPVVFTSSDNNSKWGGIELHETKAEFSHCFFIRGGANPAKPFFHGNCQPVILADAAEVLCRSCYFIDNTGKALGSNRSRVELDSCHIARCASGGEFVLSSVAITGCHISEIPNGDGIFADNDNDGFYFLSYHPDFPGPSKIINTTIITGKDDAIDHNTARLVIDHCWLEDFMHEGIAASEAESVSVINTVIKRCDQGIEAGYGTPTIHVNHCVIVENNVGLRFGDSYDIGCSGIMTVENTILYDNKRDVYNFDLKTGAAVENKIQLNRSLVQTVQNAVVNDCINETPHFDDQYYLKEDSPGINSGNDGYDIGLVRK